MQLLDSEQLEYAFQKNGISLDAQARQFHVDIWNIIKAAEKIRDPLELADCENDLRHRCRAYFDLMRGWQREEEERFEDIIRCPLSRETISEAWALIPTFEKQFYRYALCYLELNRALIQMRGKLSRYAQGYTPDKDAIDLEVNNGTGEILIRAHRDRAEVMDKRARLERVRHLLQRSDPIIESLGAELPRIMGQEIGDHQLTLFKGTLRKKQFDEARKIVSKWKQADLRKAAGFLIDHIQKNVVELRAADGIILHSGELSLMSAFLRGDEMKLNAFLDKFNLPYLTFQYRNLIHQGYLLGHVGSLEGLIIQHAKLVCFAARPLEDAHQARIQEQQVLAPIREQTHVKFRPLRVNSKMRSFLSMA